MPVNTLLQRAAQPTRGIPMLGTINKGGIRTEEMIAKKKPGPDLTYLRVEFNDRFSHMRGAFERLYGKEPTVLDPVFVLGNTPDEAFEFWREHRDMNGKRIDRRCDGDEQQMWYTPDGSQHQTKWGEAPIPCLCKARNLKGTDACRYAGRLCIVLPELYEATGYYGFFLFTTGSQNDISAIFGALQKFYAVAKLEVLAFRLVRGEPEHVSWQTYKGRDGEQKTSDIKKSLVYLEPSTVSKERLVGYLNARLTDTPGFQLGGGDGAQNATALPSGAALTPAQSNDDPFALDYVEPGMDSGDPEPGMDTILPGEFTETDADEGEERYLCSSVFVQFDKATGYTFVARCDAEHNYPMTEHDLTMFAALGYDVSDWSAKGKVIRFDPALMITVEAETVVEVARA